jgi:DNA-binding response OmpR family regulator
VAEAQRRILVADDEPGIREALSFALAGAGYLAECHPDGRSAWESLQESPPDLAVFDIMMPLMDGLELLRNARARLPELPVIFLTSRYDEFDRVLGLELGADDYLCKPFSVRELLARIKILLRKAERLPPRSPPARASAEGLSLNPDSLWACWGDAELRFTVTEFRLLRALADKPGVVLEREALLRAIYPDERFVEDRSVDCHVKRVRRKLEAAGAPAELIETVYGMGYRFRSERNRG